MAFVLDLFTPETWAAFKANGASVSGFSERQRTRASQLVKVGDIFLCYMVRLSRWCGALEVTSTVFEDRTPIFKQTDDPYVVRFKVKPLVMLDDALAIPLAAPEVWEKLSITRKVDRNQRGWTYKVGIIASLKKLEDADGRYLLQLLRQQQAAPKSYPLTDQERKALEAPPNRAMTTSGPISVVIPEEGAEAEEDGEEKASVAVSRESIRIQANVATIGARMGFDIWVPRGDKARVRDHIPQPLRARLVDILPLNYNDVTLKTVEQIDVLWLKKRTIVRAFEIEHTTAIYSGLLRMADLLALQPNIEIKLHIVAPKEKRAKVLGEIRRPVFSLLDGGPLAKSCSYIPYEAIESLIKDPNLEFLNDGVISRYDEFVEEE